MDNLPETASTPMISVWKVVLATIVLTSVIGFLWHTMSMAKIRAVHAHEAAEVRKDIVRLSAYRDQLKSGVVRAPEEVAPL